MSELVAVYADKGTSNVGVESLKRAIPIHLARDVKLVNATQIIQGELKNCVALIMPGGADLPYCQLLNGKGNQQIQQFVEQGGLYIGICAGAYYACQEIDFTGLNYTVAGQRELAFFKGIAKGSLPQWTNNIYFDESILSKNMVNLRFNTEIEQPFYYHGGPTFLSTMLIADQVIATYPDNSPAIITGTWGKGYYLLSGIHFELQAVAYQHYIVQSADEAIRFQEQKFCQLFDEDYGKHIWAIIKTLIAN